MESDRKNPTRLALSRRLFIFIALLFFLPGAGWGEPAHAGQGASGGPVHEAGDSDASLQGPSGTDIYYGTPGRPASEPAPRPGSADYPRYGNLDSRLAIWIVTQQHTYFGGFVLALPIFCLIIEVMGLLTRDRVAAVRYDRLARDFLRISLIAFSLSSLLGVSLVVVLVTLYPSFFGYMAGVFKSMMGIYAMVFLAESGAIYLYYYSWERMREGGLKWLHAAFGVVLNVFGTILLFLANSWVSFMMSPAGVDESGRFLGNAWHTLHTALWNPFNVHRFLADMMTGGAVVLGYSAFRFLTAKNQDQKSYYDWMGYVFLFITMAALIPMPFAGYWLMRSVYEFRQQLGVTMMGGMLTWMFVLQAIAVGALFIGANYYLWQGMARMPGAERYHRYIKYLLGGLVISFLVWFTPHTLVLTSEEAKAMGGAQHPVIGNYGVMSAKNGAINFMILLSALSYILYERTNKVITAQWARMGNFIIGTVFLGALANVIGLSVHGFYLPANVRVGLSFPQAMSTLTAVVVGLLVNRALLRGAAPIGPVVWGRMPVRGQVTLFLLGMAFTWVMGLMGFIRSSGRLGWHVHEIMRDGSPWAFTPGFGFAAGMVTLNMALFWVLLLGVFWVSQRTLAQAEAPERLWAGTSSQREQAFAPAMSNEVLLRDG
jgi:cytochrome bd-type quinol oxidase subunit 1